MRKASARVTDQTIRAVAGSGSTRGILLLGAVAGVDVNVFLGEIAGPDRAWPFAGMQDRGDRHIPGEHFLMNGELVESVFAAAAANGDACDPDIDALTIEFHAGAARGGEDAAPVRIGSGEGGFHQRRIRNGPRELIGGAIGGGAAHFNFDHTLRAFAVFDDGERERHADALESRAESFVIGSAADAILARRIGRWQKWRRCRS